MSVALGCDVGSLFTKLVLLRDGQLLASRVTQTTGTIARDLEELLEELLRGAGVQRAELEGVVSTGSGRELVADVDFEEEPMSCVGVAVRQHLSDVSLVLDVGGQSITSMQLDAEGDVVNFMLNDKCASGSGRFLEVMSQALGIPITELDESASGADRPAPISSQCGVFVESEVITHLNAGVDPAQISAGLCDSVARIVVSQARRFAGDDRIDYCLTGGVARIRSVVEMICQRLEGTYHPFPLDPQLAAAYGAALLAAECEEG
jgi:predicted CoA-substrate-specific enzyme activase